MGYSFSNFIMPSRGFQVDALFLSEIASLSGWIGIVNDEEETDWLRNTASAGMRQYLMTTEKHFAAAVKGEPKAAQNAAQQVHAKARNASQIVPTAHEKTPALPGFAGDCELLQPTEVAGTGFEPATSRL